VNLTELESTHQCILTMTTEQFEEWLASYSQKLTGTFDDGYDRGYSDVNADGYNGGWDEGYSEGKDFAEGV
jgi:hypothetical protein